MRIPPAQINELDFYPPFQGFPREGITFLKKLKKNNNRPWFAKHKGEYELLVKLPMQSLIVALQPHFARLAPDYELHPKRSLFRIYRDTRFSKDKTPYKTHVAAHAVPRGKLKGLGVSGYYLHIEPGMVYAGAGVYMPDGDQLKKIRRAIVDRSDDFLTIVGSRRFRKMFGELEMNDERLKRVPPGFDSNHPMAEWLRYRHYFVGVEWPESKCYTTGLVDELVDVFETADPFVKFLNSAIMGK